ncbi:Uncharacterised protein [Vibrio cholerae]|nr:Uncharacterised protein [Vibrio cholerae]
MFKAHRHFKAPLTMIGGDLIQQMCGCDVTHHRTFPAFVLQQVVVKQDQHFVRVNKVAFFIDDAKAVRIAIGADTDVITFVFHQMLQAIQGGSARRRHQTTEIRVFAIVDHVHVAAAIDQYRLQRVFRHPEHRVDQHS